MKKGFTLIELLAVIVILAIIALIATPIILNIIDDAKISSVKSSMNNIEKALELYHHTSNNIDNVVFTCKDSICEASNGDKLKVSGQLPSKGTITISKSGRITYNSVVLSGYVCDKISDEFVCNLASKNIVSSESNSIVINNNTSTNLNNYRIYGNGIQNEIPTAENPSQIKSVGDMSKNLINWDYLLLDDDPITKVENGYYSEHYAFSYRNPLLIEQLKSVLKPNVTYTLSRIYNGEMDASNGMIVIKNANGEVLVKCNSGSGFKSVSFSLTQEQIDSINSIHIYFRKNGAIISNLQLQEGSSVTEYEPYGKYKIQLTVEDKNLLNFKDYIQEGKIKEIEDGIQFEVTNSRIDVGIEYTFKANTTYVLSAECTGDAYVGGNLYADFTAFMWCGSSTKKLIFKNSSNEDIKELIRFVDTTGTKGSTVKFAMLEIADDETNYTAYKEPAKINIYLDEPLRKVGDYVDYIDFYNKILVRNVGVLTLTGEENWGEKEGIYYLADSLKVGIDKEQSIATHFKYEEGSSGFWIDSSGKLNIKNELVNSIEEFKAWLKDNKVTIYYPLKKSIIEEVELPVINLNDNYSNISIDTDINPSKMMFQYN